MRELYKARRKALINKIKNKQGDQFVIALFAFIEHERAIPRQESSFYYFTGITDPGCVAIFDQEDNYIVYTPKYQIDRTVWEEGSLSHQDYYNLGVKEIRPLGESFPGYHTTHLCSASHYQHFISFCNDLYKSEKKIATALPSGKQGYIDQGILLSRLASFHPFLNEQLIDISDSIHEMRRTKNQYEIDCLQKAIDITIKAHHKAAEIIASGNATEKDVQMGLEKVMFDHGTVPAFPSIVAGGKNATILHYTKNSAPLRNGDLVVVDIGAEYNYYCADITRTYSVSGKFTERQQFLYNLVLDTQSYIGSKAKPGMWLNNKDKPKQSLHYLAQQFLRDAGGYDKYFPHGIGHYLGMDTHDVGDYKAPLQEGDVITIEPGIYIKEEGIGIRIEDDYLVTKNDCVCLSEKLPK